ncbi:hypothetical protein HYH03_005218 [Edaphochlamys debaryana]|uniref:Major facilitator superfamily (MFS) profile domain-containing protein n=1 Tax=Edaphochlamys debaryana TaxID=47281 RepID=A0A836C1E1_9CHLO|nr:hypothetical protein HYH03_005218 [Edaphochlamys debaryana]|eukprot:KAG2496811.1 hypothetical protein HYH03_005218 [Edaphochlamys debaryana]
MFPEGGVNGATVLRKVNWAILPLFCLVSAFCYIDRTNLAFASIQLNRDLGFNAQVYGLGSGLFFLGYSLFMVPSNLVMMRVGAPRWLGIQVTVWGLVAASFATLSSPSHFYWLRFALGAAEAGAFPGMWYYLYLFYPLDQMTLPLSVMEAAVAGANVAAAPLAAVLLTLGGVGALAGWQWLFLVEGVCTVALGLATASALPSGLSTASFLTGHERHWLMQRVEPTSGAGATLGSSGMLGSVGAGREGGGGGGGGTREALKEALSNGKVWYVAIMGLFKNMASHGILFWAPIINKALLEHRDLDPVRLDWTRHRGGDTTAAAATPVGAGGAGEVENEDGPELIGGMVEVSTAAVLLTGIPFACAAFMAIWLGRRSQAKHERALHLAVPYFAAAVLLASLPRLASAAPVLAFLAVAAAVSCVQGTNSIINSYVSVIATGSSMPVAMALYNAVANLGGLLGPWLIGEMVWRTGGYGDAFRVLGAVMGAAAVMAWRTQRWPRVGGPAGGAAGGDGVAAAIVAASGAKGLSAEDPVGF